MTGVQCPICGSSNHTILGVDVRHAENIHVHNCVDCELVYLWPQPDEARLKAFYESEYRDVYKDPTPAERHQNDTSEAQLRLKRLMPLLSKEKRLLEVGSGSFAFLKNVEPYVETAIGIEPDQKTRDWFAQVSELRTLPAIEALSERDGKFDVIVLFHVLEHVTDPISFLKQLSTHLKPGGKLVVEVPNADDALISLYNIQAFKAFYYSIAHLTYLAPKTLERCARDAGLSGDVTCIQRYDISNHFHWAVTNRPGGQAVYSSVLTVETNEKYAQDLIRAGKADTLWGVFACG